MDFAFDARIDDSSAGTWTHRVSPAALLHVLSSRLWLLGKILKDHGVTL